MKKLPILLAILAVFLWIGNAAAITIDGDLSDWGINLNNVAAANVGYLDSNTPTGGVDIDYVTEDNADMNNADNPYPYNSGRTDNWINVGPGWSDGNTYDAEAIYFDNDAEYGYIAIITGLPFKGADWAPGDIGLDLTTHTAKLLDGGADTGTSTPYEAGIDIEEAKLLSVSSWESAYYDGSPSPNYANYSNPWAVSSGTIIDGVSLAYSDEAVNGHYVIEAMFLLEDLGLKPGDTFVIHWSMQCGNDFLNLEADVNPVPEPATMLLFGIGLCGLAFVGRKRLVKER